MANLSEVSAWEEGIYRIETTDPVLGGEDGPDNIAAKQLGNRTRWLKDQIALLALIMSPAFEGVPTAPTAAMLTSTNQIATTAFVQAEIERVVDAAPEAINTLAEIGDALNNDPDFAATITAALALKAPSESPAFSGDPTAPTQAPGESSTKLATTAFVTAAVAAAVAVENATTTISGIMRLATGVEAAAGSLGNVAISPSTLKPLLDLKLDTSAYTAADVLAKLLTVDGNGTGLDADLIRGLPGDFSRSLVTDGYQKLPGGLLLQWGRRNNIANSATVSVSFPLAFPTACLAAFPGKITGGNNTGSIPSFNATSLSIHNRPNFSDATATANDYFWFAIGV